MSTDSFACLGALLEELPRWIADLESILQDAAQKQATILLERQPLNDTGGHWHQKPPRSSSLRSRASDEDHAHQSQPEQALSQAPLLRPQLPHLTDSDALRLSQRKRKTVSVCSDNRSGPAKYRMRGMVVVYYDGETQKRFEAMVRAISVRRSAIRKEKLGGKLNPLSRIGWVNMSAGGAERPSLEVDDTMGPDTAEDLGMMAAFDKVDKYLDKAQGLCERAAHQILRDGDCALEIRQAKEQFAEARDAVQAAILNRHDVGIHGGKQSLKEDSKGRDSAHVEDGPIHQGLMKLDVAKSPSPPLADGGLALDLEVDDEEGDEEFAADMVQLGKFQSRRIMAH